MAIYRGPGGAGDATTDSSTEAAAALAAAAEAEVSATSAANSATSASNSATTATTQATNASNSATAAASSASAASTSASNASTSATNAASSATTATTKASEAASSATAAASSASAASTSATNAASSASAASTSATNAASSATSAANSATTATTQATNASNSATAAASSATSAASSASTATTQATNASNSATAAATSATNAATSETNAANSAISASTSATNAANSASAASTSATNASNSASAASTSATDAASSATSAASSASAAAASYDSFDDRYLGSKSSAPTLDNDGNALLTGALYFDTTSNSMKVYNGTAWLDAYASLSGALLATNNLSDLNSVSTARTNLGLDTAALVADNTLVHLAGTETITGAKTFSSTITGSITGNAGTVTNGVYTSGSYADPTWLTSIAGSKVSGNISGNAATATTATNQSGGTVAATTGSFSSSVTLSGGTANGVAYLNGSKVLTTGSALTFDGNTLTATNTSGNAIIASRGSKNLGLTGNYAGANTHAVISTTNGMALAFMDESSEYMRLTSTGLGIGTSSPGYTLDVSGFAAVQKNNGGAQAQLRLTTATDSYATAWAVGNNPSSLDFGITNFNGSWGSPLLTLTPSGNLGLGVTPSAWSASFKALESTSGNSFYATSSASALASNAYNDGAWKYKTTAGAGLYANAQGSHQWYTAPSGTAGNAITFTQAMTLDASGNLGIGTSSPANYAGYKTLTIDATTGGVIDINVSGTRRFSLYGNSDGATVEALSAYPVLFRTNSTERMRIDSSGNVGIGTSSPSVRLHVVGSNNANNAGIAGGSYGIRFENGVTYGLTGSAISGVDNTFNTSFQPLTLNGSQLGFAIGGTERMRIDSSGNLKFDSGYGSVTTAYGCRAWVNFNGTSTVAIRASGNVSSITDNGTGDYTVNFTTAMPDANYSVSIVNSVQWGQGYPAGVFYTGANGSNQAPTTSGFRFTNANTGGSHIDPVYSNCSVFR